MKTQEDLNPKNTGQRGPLTDVSEFGWGLGLGGSLIHISRPALDRCMKNVHGQLCVPRLQEVLRLVSYALLVNAFATKSRVFDFEFGVPDWDYEGDDAPSVYLFSVGLPEEESADETELPPDEKDEVGETAGTILLKAAIDRREGQSLSITIRLPDEF